MTKRLWGHHRLVVYRQQLLAQRLGDRVQPGAATASQDDALAAHGVLVGAGAGFDITVLRGSTFGLTSTLPA